MQVITKPAVKITKSTIESAWRQRAKDQRLIIRDKECRGLALIVNPTSMTWTYAYRPRGANPNTKRRWPNKVMTLGNPATHSPEDARNEANRIKGLAAQGADPVAEKKAAAAKANRKRAAILGPLVEEYAKALPKRPKRRGTAGLPSPAYVDQELAQLRLAIADMGTKDLAVADLTEAAVQRLLENAEGVTTGRKRFGALSRFLDWCRDSRYIEVNPCSQIPGDTRPRAPQPRTHYLMPAELARLWKAAEALEEPVWRDLVRFLIAVPCRRNEATQLDWSHLDFAAAEWRQPGQMTKNRDPHRLHLHDQVLELLKARRRVLAEAQADGDPAKLARLLAAGQPRSGLVFPAPVSGRPIDTFSDIKAALVKATGPQDEDERGDDKREEASELAGWTWHDFRRSFATALGEASIPEAVADAVLNHRQSATRGGVLGVYQRASRWPEQVRAMNLWGRLLSAALDGTGAAANVVPMAAHAG